MINQPERLRLAARREQLVQRAGLQRQQFARAAAPLAQSARWAERGLRLWGTLRRHPWLLALPAAALAWWRPRRALRTLAGTSALWRAGRAVLRLLRSRRA
jgi:hypothetical protein